MRRGWIAAVAVLAGLVLTGCPPYSGNPDGPRVGLWGDSTMDLERDDLPARLNDRYQTSLEAHPGYGLAELQDLAATYALSNPDVVVISAGMMDAWILERPWDGFQELLLIGATVSRYQGCVVWVNVLDGSAFPAPGVDPEATRRADAFNAALGFWATRYPRLRIVDWNGEVLSQGVDRLLQPWNPHASLEGRAVLARLIDEAVSTC